MTRPDFLEGAHTLHFLCSLAPLLNTPPAELDRLNIINIDVRSFASFFLFGATRLTPPGARQIHHDVRPDSMLILRAAREVCENEEFDDVLDSVRARVDEIESLHRTRELTVRLPLNTY